jgi:hypothetical protein
VGNDNFSDKTRGMHSEGTSTRRFYLAVFLRRFILNLAAVRFEDTVRRHVGTAIDSANNQKAKSNNSHQVGLRRCVPLIPHFIRRFGGSHTPLVEIRSLRSTTFAHVRRISTKSGKVATFFPMYGVTS